MEAKQGLGTRDLAGDVEYGEPATTEERDTASEPREQTATGREQTATGREQTATSQLAGDAPALLPADENSEFQRRWETIQTGFVDEPRQTVEQADELVAHVMKRLAEGFAAERERLEQQWGRGEDVSTEDLRVALQRYRGFFQRLLSA